MNKKPEAPREPIPQEHPADAPAGWATEQDILAGKSGVSFLLFKGHQPPAIVISNNNSICAALQSSPEHVKLCDPYCGEAHRLAMSSGRIHYKCHAGLNCFAQPVKISRSQNLVVIGGRAFNRRSEYDALVERFLSGDLKWLLSEEVFKTIIFAEAEHLDAVADRVTRAAAGFRQPGQVEVDT